MTDPSPLPEPERWCRGCRRVGTRALTDAERAWIARLQNAHRWRAALGLPIVPAAILVGIAFSAWLPHPPSAFTTTVMGVWSFLTLLLGLPVSILVVHDHVRASRALGADRASGTTWVFEPPRDVAPLAAAESAPAPKATPFALLATSRRVLDLGDLRPRVSREDIIEVEPHSGSSLYAPLSLEVVHSPPGLRFHQRALSAAERLELEMVGRRLARPQISTVIVAAATIAVLILAAAAVRQPHRPGLDSGDVFGTVLLIVACVFALVRDARGMMLSGRIRHDLQLGLVVRADQDAESGAEFLPVSGLLWRLGGAPAEWRDRGRGADRIRRGL